MGWGRSIAVLSACCAAFVAGAQDATLVSPADIPPAADKPKGYTYYVGPEGVPTLTNRHNHYQHRQEFVAVTIKYEPIFVPDRFSAYRSALEYSTVTIEDLTKQYAHDYRLDLNLVLAVIKAESDFNPYAVSSKGARGLMQLMPGTAQEMGVKNVFDPAENIAAGTQYLALMLKEFGTETLAIAAYNAGPAAVKKHHGVPPYPETRDYVKRVQAFKREFAAGHVKLAYNPRSVQPRTAYLPIKGDSAYVVHFHSGLTQPAHEVEDAGDFYHVVYDRYTFAVRKALVKKIVNTA